MNEYPEVTALADKARAFQRRIENCLKKYGTHVLIARISQLSKQGKIASWGCIHCGICLAPDDWLVAEYNLRILDTIKGNADSFALHVERGDPPKAHYAEGLRALLYPIYSSPNHNLDDAVLPRFRELAESITEDPL